MCRVILATLVSMVAIPLAARHATCIDFDVPGGFATLQEAVEAAAASAAVDNTVTLSMPVTHTTAEVVFDNRFSATRRLVVRPHPDLAGRAIVLSHNGCDPIFRFVSAGYVTLQDLDVFRNTTNCDHLIVMVYGAGAQNTQNVIERCRIGYTWTVPGAPGYTYVLIQGPYGIVLRNNVFFSYVPGAFDVGIHAYGFSDPAQSLYLYNNVIADPKVRGISINDAVGGTHITLRNNVVVNNESVVPEPWAYWTDVAPAAVVATSHNTAFASLGGVQGGAGQSLCCEPPDGPTFRRFDRDEVGDAFMQHTWVLDPDFDSPADNENLYRLEDLGILHTATTRGATVIDGGGDIAVVDDFEKDVRPSGEPLHTDRGADQVEETLVGVVETPSAANPLRVSARTDASGAPVVRFESPANGLIRLEAFDASGRRLFERDRIVRSGEIGTIAWPEAGAGVYYYRATLVTAHGAMTANGRMTIVR